MHHENCRRASSTGGCSYVPSSRVRGEVSLVAFGEFHACHGAVAQQALVPVLPDTRSPTSEARTDIGWHNLAATHNPKVVGSSPVAAAIAN